MGFNFSKLLQVQQELENARTTPTDHNSLIEPDKTPPDLPSEEDLSDTEHNNRRRNSLDKFQRELMEKRRQRQDALAGVRNELTTLRAQLEEKSAVNDQLTAILLANGLQLPETVTSPQIRLEKSAPDVMDKQTNTNSREASEATETDVREVTEPPRNLRIELAVAHHDLQKANDTILDLQTELNSTKTYATSLKDVISVSKQMVQVREDQLNELKSKLNDIESTMNEREAEIMSTKLREEYMEQLEKMKNLRTLYEERARLSVIERENLRQELDAVKQEYNLEIEKSKNLEARVLSLEASLLTSQEETSEMKTQFSLSKAESRDLQAQISVINLLFSQIILGATEDTGRTAPLMDFDKLIVVLEEHRGLLNDITMDDDSFEGAAYFPKLLYDLINQDEDGTREVEVSHEDSEAAASTSRNVKISEIAEKLPKVWRILIEFLSHQKDNTTVAIAGDSDAPDVPEAASASTRISVSKTFIKLKDLIVEKKELQKQTNRLKTLNSHLEKRLQSQEKRMGIVTVELSKTWNMVGRMQRQHRQLHTNEQVLRYQLFQKRRLLNELKEELEYCRRKWTAARQKNNDTEEQWKVLRTEFSNRKLTSIEDANQQSAESGYSGDEQLSDDDALERKPKYVDVKPTFSDSPPEKTPALKKPRKPETAEEMFMRLTGQSFTPEEPASTDEAGPSSDILQPKEFVIEQDTEDLFDLEVPMPVPCSFTHPVMAESPQNSKPVVAEEVQPPVYKLTTTEEEYLDKRQRRLERLEREAAEFHKRMSTNKERSNNMCTKLDDLHDRYSQNRKQRNEKKSNEAGTSSGYRRPRLAKMDATIRVLSDAEIKYTEDRASRIQSLEEQCTDLLTKIRTTTSRGSAIAQQLDSLHERSVERAANSRFGSGAFSQDTVETEDDIVQKANEVNLVEPNSDDTEFDELIENAEAEWHATTNLDSLENVLFEVELEGSLEVDAQSLSTETGNTEEQNDENSIGIGEEATGEEQMEDASNPKNHPEPRG